LGVWGGGGGGGGASVRGVVSRSCDRGSRKALVGCKQTNAKEKRREEEGGKDKREEGPPSVKRQGKAKREARQTYY